MPAGGELAFESSAHHDFGHVTEGDVLEHSFGIQNRGKTALALDPPREVLGCGAKVRPSLLPPGGRGRVEVTCRADVHGPLRVTLPLRGALTKPAELTLTGEVEPLIAFDRRMLDIDLPFGDQAEVEARLRGKLAMEARPTLASVGPTPGLKASLLSAEPGRPAGVRLALRGTKVGSHVGSVVVSTGLEHPRTASLPYSIKVRGTLEVSPTNPYLKIGGPPVDIVVKSTRPGFVLERAQVLSGPFSAVVTREGTGFRVSVRVLTEQVRGETRGVQGRLRIVSNDHSEPEKDLPLVAIGGI